MFPRTVVQYASPSRPLPRQHILFERPFWLFLRNLCLPVTHRWGSVGLSSHSSSVCVGTLALFAGDRRARALQGIVCSTTKRVRRPVLPPTLHSCGSLSKSFGPSLCPPPPPLSGSCLDSLSASSMCVSSKACASPLAERCSSCVCRISVPCGVSLLLLAALNARCVLAVVCFVLWTDPMSALHREMWGEQNVLCLPVIVEPSPML